jgi:hypothetical protein
MSISVVISRTGNYWPQNPQSDGKQKPPPESIKRQEEAELLKKEAELLKAAASATDKFHAAMKAAKEAKANFHTFAQTLLPADEDCSDESKLKLQDLARLDKEGANKLWEARRDYYDAHSELREHWPKVRVDVEHTAKSLTIFLPHSLKLPSGFDDIARKKILNAIQKVKEIRRNAEKRRLTENEIEVQYAEKIILTKSQVDFLVSAALDSSKREIKNGDYEETYLPYDAVVQHEEEPEKFVLSFDDLTDDQKGLRECCKIVEEIVKKKKKLAELLVIKEYGASYKNWLKDVMNLVMKIGVMRSIEQSSSSKIPSIHVELVHESAKELLKWVERVIDSVEEAFEKAKKEAYNRPNLKIDEIVFDINFVDRDSDLNYLDELAVDIENDEKAVCATQVLSDTFNTHSADPDTSIPDR